MDLQGFIPDSKYCIFDLAGKTVKEGIIVESKTHIDTKNLEKGEYTLKIFSDGMIFTIKIIRNS